MASRQLKPITLILGLALGGATLLSWTTPWFVVDLVAAASHDPIEAPGETAAPALAALGLAGLAMVAALTIAGPVFRVVLSVLTMAIGASVGLSAWGALSNPVSAVAPLVSEATGITGEASVRALVAGVAATAWPATALAIGIATVLLGAFMAATVTRWPSKPSRYQTVRLETGDGPRSAVSDWDSLSDGDDPTSR